MERFTVSLDQDLLGQFDDFIRRRGYSNLSEAVRDILRNRLEAERLEQSEAGDCIACLSYVYNHHERELSRRLTQAGHSHHDLTQSTLHVHLDHDDCMEVVILHGPTEDVRKYADATAAETGVRHGAVNIVPVESRLRADHSHGRDRRHDHHDHGHDHDHDHDHPHPHVHSSPKT